MCACVDKIRFTNIDMEDLISTVIPSEVLDSQREIEIHRYVESTGKLAPPKGFSLQNRYKPGPHHVVVPENLNFYFNTLMSSVTFYVNISCMSDIKIQSFCVGFWHIDSYYASHYGQCYTRTSLSEVLLFNRSNNL